MSMLWLLAARAFEEGRRAQPRGVLDLEKPGGDDVRDAACEVAAAGEPDAACGSRDGRVCEVG